MSNKVKFNIKNVHYAVKSEGTYATPVAIPGAVSVALEPQGELTPFYADGIKYYISNANSGYEGDLEMALITDQFRKDVLKETEDTNKVLVENADIEAVEFALGFDIDGDKNTTRFWFYSCTATRPGANGQTTEGTKTPVTEKITISATPDKDGNVRAKTTESTPEDVINNWYKSVYKSA